MKNREENFEKEYKNLNHAQKEAVDTIDGPVMVVAGPGTGKTQILALRIGNILLKTDTKADSILCLTFTNAAVSAMKDRLDKYIGETSTKVNIFTFHSFGMKIIEEHFKVLGLENAPKLLEGPEAVVFFDEILSKNEWEYLRPRADSARYFADLRSLISLLKRERISTEDFISAINKEIKSLESDEASISTRGASKGELKKEIVKQIEGLERSREIVKFIELYEEAKKEKNVLDYDDVLSNLVKIVETSVDAVSDIREKYLYILIDEHQDSSRVQNDFLARVWGGVEAPNVFVVGDDRQLIYGFSGASIDHFQGFQKTFQGAKIIPLVENYRSTQVILDASHALLQSVMSDTKLHSQSKEHHSIQLVEADTPKEEIVAAGLDIQEKMKKGLNPNDCAILLPKNRQVRTALEILYGLGLPVATLEALNLFDQEEAMSFFRVLKIMNDDRPSLALSFFDTFSGVPPLEAHVFLAGENMREFSFDTLFQKKSPTLFGASNKVEKWIEKLFKWKKDSQNLDIKFLIETIGKELFVGGVQGKKLVSGKEILDTFLVLLAPQLEKNKDVTLAEFVSYIEKIESYGEHVSLAAEVRKGIKVLTMHGSKGLEFEYVWIAHMDERSLTSGKKMAFTLPESIAEKIEERDIDAIKRKLYVAITRAKRFCILSYATQREEGGDQEVARLIADLPSAVFERKKVKSKDRKDIKINDISPLIKLVKEKYTTRNVSVSLLNNFFECPWKWYFRNILQLPEAKSESLEFGSAVHEAIDTILKLGHAPSEKELGDLALNKEAMKIILRWVTNRLPEIKPNHKTEESIPVKDERYPHLKIYGKIDLIENLGPKEVRVTDFKTGGVKKKSEIEKIDDEGRMSNYLRQLSMYSYLLKENPKWNTDARESRLEFLEAKNPKETFYERVINPKEISLLIKDIQDYDQLVKDGEWPKRECNYNSYGKNTECEYCKMAEVYYR